LYNVCLSCEHLLNTYHAESITESTETIKNRQVLSEGSQLNWVVVNAIMP
jgi:hypothetical protein